MARGISGKALGNHETSYGSPTFLLKKSVSGATTSFTVLGDADFSFKVLDAWAIATGAGGSGDTVRVDNGSTAITDALDLNVSDKVLVRAGTIDDAQQTISKGDALKITTASSAAADVYILCSRV